jgi:ubiquinone/menaquinone biosynthesis C-methylase UbiE
LELVSGEYLKEHKVSITIVNIPGTTTPKNHGIFKFVEADCCDLSGFDDNSYHIAHSNSVIEHVGDWERMTQFARELARVAPKYFVQTPNYWFPIEPHFMTPFFQWLPEPVRMWLVLNFQLGHRQRATSIDEAVRSVESVRLLNRKMVRALFENAEVLTEKYFYLAKSFIAVKK